MTAPPDVDRGAVTGGNGTIGRAVLRELAAHGYETVNCSRGSRQEQLADHYQRVDLLDAGAVYGALAGTDVDTIVHLGTIPRPIEHPEHVVYESNVQTAYHVLEAAQALDVERVVLPSSVNVLGASYQDEPVAVEYLPVDEAHPLSPRDPYAVAKHAMEVTADGVARRADAPSIVSVRYPWVADDDQLRQRFEGDPDDLDAITGDLADSTRDVLCTYLHVDDAASVARRAVEAPIDGHERVWAVADDTITAVPTEDVIEACYPDAELRAALAGTDALVSTTKARTLLDWSPERSWRELA